MKKLYRKGTVHPSPPSTSDHLSFLPAAILALAVALSPEEKEVLAYLISSSFGNHHHCRRNSSINTTTCGDGGSGRRSTDHPVSFNCYCFGCYMSYWVKWDSSPNRQLIHEIIDAFEEAPSSAAAAANGGKKEKSKKVRRKNNKKNPTGSSSSPVKIQGEQAVPAETTPEVMETPADAGGADAGGLAEEEEMGKGSSVRSFVGFVGEKIWGIWS